MKVGIPKEILTEREARRRRPRDGQEDPEARPRGARRGGRGRGRALPGRRLRGGRRARRPAPPSSGPRPTSSSRCARPSRRGRQARGRSAERGRPRSSRFIWPAQQQGRCVERLAARKATVLAMDCVPRITRAQKMDALSRDGEHRRLPRGHRGGRRASARFFTGQVTAAGRVKPAQVLVIGAGVAGLAAIARGRRRWARSCARSTRAPPCASRSRAWAAQFLEFEFKEAGEGEGGYAKEMSEAYIAAEQALIAAAREGGRHHHHDRAHPRQAGAEAHHVGRGRQHEARAR